jgi:hypothetical protein
MAARKLRPLHSDEVRAKIQTSQLLNRLSDHALGKVELSATQVRAIEVLIKKTLPDLSAMDLTATHQGEIVAKVVFKGLNG